MNTREVQEKAGIAAGGRMLSPRAAAKALFLMLAFLAGPALAAGLSSQPNFLLIILDDWGWEDVGAYGNAAIHTPNIDQLAREGLRFDNAFLTTSSCTASRASILTGRYPHNSGASRLGDVLALSKPLFPEYLKAAGYFTAGAGKWHLGEPSSKKLDDFRHLTTDDEPGTANWLQLLRDRPRDKPFFILLAAMDPHLPHTAAPVYGHVAADIPLPPYLPDTPAVRQAVKAYYDEVARADDYIGQVLQELEQQGVADNTLILLLSDNGAPFPRGKLTLFDSGIKTPFIARWPTVIVPGGVNRSMVSAVDIAPTLLQLAGVAVPAELPGQSLAAVLRGESEGDMTRLVFAEQNIHARAKLRKRAVRDNAYLYIRNDHPDTPLCLMGPVMTELARLRDEGQLGNAAQFWCLLTPPAEELFDVVRDPYSLYNLAAEPVFLPELERYRAHLQNWEAETRDWFDSCLKDILPCVSRYD